MIIDLRELGPKTSRLIVLCILVASAICFLPSLMNDFVNRDDPSYVLQNPLIKEFSLQSIWKIFTTTEYMGNYHPITLLSYFFQYRFFGDSPFGYHLVSVLLHLATTLLVYLFAFRLTNCITTAALTGVLFGVHPIHVESVAWISQQKDLLFTIFFLCSLLSYLRYRMDGKTRAYILSLIFFLFSLLSKGMGVALPIVVLLIDWYQGRRELFGKRSLLEKLPYAILAVIFGLMAVYAQRSGSAIPDTIPFTMLERIALPMYAFMMYIMKFIAPIELSPFHQYPGLDIGTLPASIWIIALSLIVLIYIALKSAKKFKIIAFGLGMYAASILFVLQILPVGGAIIAERYGYLSSVGIFLALSSGVLQVNEILRKNASKKILRNLILGVLGVYLIALGIGTWNRCGVWKNSFTLWNDAVEKSPTLPLGYHSRGSWYYASGEYELARRDFEKAVELKPDYADAWRALGLIRQIDGNHERAIADFSQALRSKPSDARAYFFRANSYASLRNFPNAFADYSKAIEYNPSHSDAFFNRGNILAIEGRYEEAIIDFSKAVVLQPNDGGIYFNRGAAFIRLGDIKRACSDFTMSLQLQHEPARQMLAQYCR